MKYGSGWILFSSIFIIPLLGAYIEGVKMRNAIHDVVDAENCRLLESRASFKWIVHLVGNGMGPTDQVQLYLTVKKGYGNMEDIEVEKSEVMEIYRELRETLGYRHPNCTAAYAKAIHKERKKRGGTQSQLGTLNLFSGQTASVAVGTGSVASEIEKLQDLRDQAVLNDAEFTAAKAKFLDL
jgi:hypothetical protein